MILQFAILLLSVQNIYITLVDASQFNLGNNAFTRKPSFIRNQEFTSKCKNVLPTLRCGGAEDISSNSLDETEVEESDEERYSRQFYTLGARAHSLVRTSTILIDGPPTSGLLYESMKNLALSGVGNIVLLLNESDTKQAKLESLYFFDTLDDLGNTYRKGAINECFPNHVDSEVNNVDLLIEFIRRLNPSVKISIMKRKDFLDAVDKLGDENSSIEIRDALGENPVLLCIDRPQSTQMLLNDACRNIDDSVSFQGQSCIPFISIETAGVYGKAFCDFGDNFHVVDEDGESPKATLIDHIGNGDEIVMHCVEGERHDVSKGDEITFQWKNGVEEEVDVDLHGIRCIVTYVNNPTSFKVKFLYGSKEDDLLETDKIDGMISMLNTNANTFERKKIPRAVSFLSMREAIKAKDDPTKEIFAASDLDKSFDPTRRSAVMSCFSTLETFVREKNSLPCHDDKEDFMESCTASANNESKSFKKISSSFVQSSRAKFTPLQAIYGAVGAQEALKAASGLYNPIKQFLLYDCDEVLQKAGKNNVESSTGMKWILGKKLCKKLSGQKLFVVGSGAIGCEILKNLSAMNVGTSKKMNGIVILTDMDTIEKSNLSRQLLFRDSDVGKFKSIAAKEAIERFNPRIRMNVHTSKVGDDSKETYFDGKFWSNGVDIVLNALDNVEARLFIDSQCVANQKALVDAGTLGAKGNVQVVVPKQSESYASSSDPPEPTIPVCTLKNFPYEISHTIQWGRDVFDGLFTRRPSQVNENKESLQELKPSEFAKSLFDKLGEDAAIQMAIELAEDCASYDEGSLRKESLSWACNLAKKLFYDSMNQLLKQHPIDSTDEDDKPFWSGTRKAPTPILYATGSSDDGETTNKYLIDFVQYTGRLRMEMYGEGMFDVSKEEAKEALLEFLESIDDDIEEKEEESFQKKITSKVKAAKINLPGLASDLNIAEFEKDDDTNGHVAFVTAASNLRALAYGITPVDAMETRRVAGRIVPAMITTTAFVSALSCIELVKLTQKADLNYHRNAFINLALPFFAFTSPLPAEEINGLHGSTYTIWDRILVKESEKQFNKGGMTLGRFIRQINKKASNDEDPIEVSNISFGPYMIYANFLHEDDDEILDTPIKELVIDAISSGDIEDDEFGNEEGDVVTLNELQQAEIAAVENKDFLDFTVIVEDPNSGEEAELPPVRLRSFIQED